jgi:hypothetical protein
MRPFVTIAAVSDFKNMIAFEQWYFGVQLYRPTIAWLERHTAWRKKVNCHSNFSRPLKIARLLQQMVDKGWSETTAAPYRLLYTPPEGRVGVEIAVYPPFFVVAAGTSDLDF